MLSDGRERRRRAAGDRLSCFLLIVAFLVLDVAVAYLLAKLWEVV